MGRHPCISGPDGKPCKRVPPPGQPCTEEYCFLCYKFAYDDAYNRAWGGNGIEAYIDEPAQTIEGPGLLRKAVNFGKAIVNEAVHTVQTGVHIVPDGINDQRLAICRTSEDGTPGKVCSYFDEEKLECKHKSCGCRMKVKTTWAGASCAIGRWKEFVDEKNTGLPGKEAPGSLAGVDS